MAKGRWKLTDEQLASEAYAVLIGRQKAGRSLGRPQLKAALKYPGIYKDFLKHCLEQDRSKGLNQFKKGLKLVVTSIGVSQLSEATGLSRLSLYRMLSKNGNPRFASLMALFRALEIHLWVVDDDFMASVQKVVRPKDITPESLPTKTYRDLGL